jgi:hypothetical protein
MDNFFKVRIKKGDFEIEVESSDKTFLESKLKELIEEKGDMFHGIQKKHVYQSVKQKKRGNTTKTSEGDKSTFNIAEFTGNIKDSSIYEEVEKNIIDKHGQLAKILMCMHFAKEILDDPYLTTGQIEAITNELNIKIGMANASKTITNNQKYFTGKTTRKKGKSVPYKLNRNGEKAFEKILKGEKPE